MRSEKIRKEELIEMLKGYELADEAVEAASGGRQSPNPKWGDCVRDLMLRRRKPRETAERWCDRDYPRYIED